MDVKPLLDQLPVPVTEDLPVCLEKIADLVRCNIHGDDVALSMEPSWVVIFSLADRDGAGAIVRQVRDNFKGGAGRMINASGNFLVPVGMAVYPAEGSTVRDLLAKATSGVAV